MNTWKKNSDFFHSSPLASCGVWRFSRHVVSVQRRNCRFKAVFWSRGCLFAPWSRTHRNFVCHLLCLGTVFLQLSSSLPIRCSGIRIGSGFFRLPCFRFIESSITLSSIRHQVSFYLNWVWRCQNARSTCFHRSWCFPHAMTLLVLILDSPGSRHDMPFRNSHRAAMTLCP